MTINEIRGKKIAIAGLGENNKHLARYFDKLGVNYTVFQDWSRPAELIPDLENFEIIFRTPGLPYLSEPIQKAKKAGAEIYSQTKLFFDLCPARIIGVTGTKGKGTTASLIGKILKEAGRRVWLAGNIGRDPFEFLDEIWPGDDVVLELSSFQLQDLRKSPHIAVVLIVTSDHLDHHKTVDEYVKAKQPIVNFQWPQDFAVLNYDSQITRSFSTLTPGKIIWNSITQAVRPGCYVEEDKIMFDSVPSIPAKGEKTSGESMEIMKTSEVKLIGRFNLENVTAAICAVAASGVSDIAAIVRAVSDFRGLPHRLEFIREFKEVKFYNDSFSTTPETAMAAISAFAEPIILIAGGSEKNADYGGLARIIADGKVKALLAIGKTGSKIAALARKAGYQGRIIDQNLEDMKEIVSACNQIAAPGDIALLSPAAASFDMFKNYKDRGEQFRESVENL